MIPWLLFTLLPLPVFALSKTHGVDPALLSKYTPSESGSWNCLDGTKYIPWVAVNDDYCDCPDGSDEPGTSACVNGTFYCHNDGHVGTSIPSLRVNDGLCEPECCDGSDEAPGVCNNLCNESGQIYRKRQAEELKRRKTGSKLRSSYIVFAHKEKKRLEALVASSSQEITVREKEVAHLQDIADRTESLSAAALEQKQKSPLYTSLITHSHALKSLQREHKEHLEREKALGDILNTLRSGYNPNYQDMAVLEAVRGWESLAGLPHIGESEEGSDEIAPEKEKEPAEQLEEGMWGPAELEHQLDDLLNADYVSLLLQHEDHISSPSKPFSFDLSAFIPDAIMPQYEDIKEIMVSWLQTFGIVGGGNQSSKDASRARQAFNDAENSLSLTRKEKEAAESDLVDLFSVNGFGVEGEWKRLDGTCLEKDVGDYKYEVCLFDEARQKPTKGGSTFSLGTFKSWNLDAAPGTPEFYSKQFYKNGAKCWNGPERSVVLVWACGTENAIHTVMELEKCEYQFTGTSPALCLAVNSGDSKKEEL